MGRVLSRTDTYEALLDRLGAVERRVRQLSNAARLGNAAIDSGAVVIRGGALIAEDVDGSVLLYVGQGAVANVPGSTQAFMIFARADGKPFFRLNSITNGDQYWAWYDETGNIIFGDDTVSGQGLARPYIPYPHRMVGTINVNGHAQITAAAMTDVAVFEGYKQHPRLRLAITAFCSDATTSGSVQVIDASSGEVIASGTIPLNTTGTIQVTLLGPVDGSHMDQKRFILQALRSAGAGNVYVAPRFAYGVQS